jgi:hypothetical protein
LTTKAARATVATIINTADRPKKNRPPVGEDEEKN